MTATDPTTDRSLPVTTRNIRRRAPTHSAEANHQVGTHLSRRHPAPAPTLTCVLPNPLKTTRSPCATATHPPARPPSRLSFPALSLVFSTSPHRQGPKSPWTQGSSVDAQSIPPSIGRSASTPRGFFDVRRDSSCVRRRVAGRGRGPDEGWWRFAARQVFLGGLGLPATPPSSTRLAAMGSAGLLRRRGLPVGLGIACALATRRARRS